MSGILYVVATPLGHLGDLSERAREILGGVDRIAAEDTRRTGQLLAHLGIRRPLVAVHEHSEHARTPALVEALVGGARIALVSDAGTPLVSDPGFPLVRAARAARVPVVPIPGPSAVTAALSVAGLPTDRFLFAGFLPSRSAARREALQALAERPETLVFFEAARRVGDTLADLAAIFGSGRPAFLAREMTKVHEQLVDGSLGELEAHVGDGLIPALGEFVLVVGGHEGPPAAAEATARELLALLLAELPASRAARIAARFTGLPRQACYRLAQALAGEPDD